MSKIGYIKYYRSAQDNPLYFSEKFTKWQAWSDLLLLANHKRTLLNVRGIVLDLSEGQLFWSMEKLAQRWKWNERTVKKLLIFLQNEGQISLKIQNRITTIEITNWAKFQGDVHDKVHDRVQDKVHDNVQPIKNDKNVNNEKKDTGDSHESPQIENVDSIVDEDKGMPKTLIQLEKNKENVINRLNTLYPNKDGKVAFEYFVSRMKIRNYHYTNHYLALCEWTRDDSYGQFKRKVSAKTSVDDDEHKKQQAKFEKDSKEKADKEYTEFIKKYPDVKLNRIDFSNLRSKTYVYAMKNKKKVSDIRINDLYNFIKNGNF